ncbi:MAG TPA: PDZ domain-containing protein [Pirellulaceae bacterium]|nr:PDZ domain-containing protein [Pirellulaceae bacterium]
MHRRLLSACAAAAIALGCGLLLADADRLDPKLLASFRDVVAQPAKSTVQVYCDGYRSALGTIVREDGYIVTKASELKGKIQCQLQARPEKLEATLVGTDATLDLAVLKIGAKNLPPIAWNEQVLPVGSWLATPGMEQDPLSIGILSVQARKIAAPAGALGIRLGGNENAAQIEAIEPGMAADKAGLKANDIVLKVNGKSIGSPRQLGETIRSYMPGEKVELLIKRGKDELTIHATLGSFSQLVHGDRAEFQNNLGGPLSERRGGFPLAIQHDSVLRPADCGGPIVDLDGKAVGLNIARAGRVESYALPASLVREAVDKLLQTHLTSAPAGDKPAQEPPPASSPSER